MPGSVQKVSAAESTTPTFTTGSAFLSGVVGSVSTADLNGDKRQDIIVANSLEHSISVLLGKDDGTFADARRHEIPYFPWSLAIGDHNGDKKMDLAVADQWSVWVLFGDGDGESPF